jgi:hypothetical protein
MKTLEMMGRKYGTDKVDHGYLNIYEKHFAPIKDNKNNILEIGVWKGSSLSLWSEYFKNSYIIGIDVPKEIKKNSIYPYSMEYSKQIEMRLKNVSIVHGDQANKNTINETVELVKTKTNVGEFDIIIDDGSHFQHDIMTSFGYLFPHLKTKGIYIIEDIASISSLERGAQWWGHSKETHHVGGFHDDNIMLAGEEYPKIENSVSYSLQEFKKNGYLSSKFLTKDQCMYITENAGNIDYYHENSQGAELAVIQKK